ncbi:MAG: hypothetical protein KAQ96_14615 [Thermoplasmata archaeon]|nr:hypothetical protein [Thermoplasmata archaeon]
MFQVRLRKTLILMVAAMMLVPALSLALSAGDGEAPKTDDAPGFVGAGEGIEPVSIDVDIYEDRFTPIMPWPTNRTFYDMEGTGVGNYILMAGSGGTLLKFNESGIEWIHTGTEESLYDIAWDWPLALIVGNHSTLLVWNAVTEDLTKIDVPLDQRFLGVTWERDEDKAIIVGNGGFIGIFNGTHVNALATGLTDYIYRIEWVPGEDYAVAVGDGGLLVKVNTTEVINSTRLDLDWGLWRLDWNNQDNFGIIVGKDYSYIPPRALVVRYNLTGTFNSFPVPGNSTSGLRSVAYNDDDLPGNGEFLITGENSTVLMCDGSSVSIIPAPSDRTLRTCHWWKPLDQGRDFFVAGSRGLIMHHVDGVWSNVSFDPREDLYSIDWRPQGDYGLVVGAGGHISKVSLNGGQVITSPVTNDLYDVDWSSDGSYALICGGGGKVLRYNHGADAATTIKEGVMALHGISIKPNANEALAVGDGGHVWHWDNGIWVDKKALGDARNLRDVAWKPNGAFAIIVGVSGAVLNFTGTGLAEVFQPQPLTYAPFFSVTWDNAGKFAMLVGSKDTTKDHDTIYVYNNRAWGPVGFNSGQAFYGCAFTADGEVGVAFGADLVTEEDYVVKFSTRTFEGERSSFRSPYTDILRGCMHPTGRAVYFAGYNGYAYRMDVGEFLNNPPVAAIASPSMVIYEIGESVELSANGSFDADDDPLTFTWESNVTGVLAQGKVAHVTFEDPGWQRITLYVDDNKAHNVSEFVIIKLVVPNYPPVPVLNSPLEGQTYTNEDVIVFDGNGSFDPNGENITYHWVSSLSGDIGYEEHMEELLRVGEHQIWLWVEDTEGVRSGETVNITVVQANRPPIVHITSPIEGQRFEHNEAVELNTTYSFDPDGETLTFEWGSDLDGYLGHESVVTVLLSEGTHMISVTANDGRGLSSTAVVNITVEPQGNIPPIIILVSPPSNTTVSGVVTVTGTASDPDGGPVTVRYAISTMVNWEDTTQEGMAWSFEWDTTALTNGQYSVFIEADDGEHTTRIFAQYFVDNAPPENQPPVVSLDSPEPGKVKGTVSLKGLASDPDGDPLTKVEVRFDSGLWQPASGTSIWTYQWGTKDVPNGPVVVTVRAFDGEDWSEYMTYDFEVANGDTEPTTDTDITLWALIGVVLVILVIAGWFLYSRRE